MKLRVVALGHRMPAWVDAGCDDYARRLPREFALELVELKPEPRDRGKPVAALLAAEAAADRRRVQGRRACVALDERGARVDDARARRRTSRAGAMTRASVAFVIGSADGSTPTVKRDAAAVVALSALTLPHGLVRVLARRAALSRGEPALRSSLSSRLNDRADAARKDHRP